MPLLQYVLYLLTGILVFTSCKPDSADAAGSATSGKDVPAASQTAPNTGGWLTVLNDAYALSVRDRKPILAYFTASDTCTFCRQLEADVFAAPVFTSWAEDNLVLFRIDIPSHTQGQAGNENQHAAMARSLKVSTFPALWMLSVTHEAENGRFKVKPIGYVEPQSSPGQLIGMLQNFMRRG